ncbi:MAG: glucokinase [Geminicoccaceae bacterium]
MSAKQRLVADIGGTHARFALCGPDGEPRAEQRLQVADHAGVVEAARAYLAGRKVAEAVFAVATPVASDWIHLTNAPWAFSIRAAREALGLQRLAVINDFAAQALAVPRLAPDDRSHIGGGEPQPGQAIAVIGPGTGLGVAGLLPVHGTWHPIPSEGGHVSLAPQDERDAALLACLRRRFDHVSNERVLSGPGLVNLATALAEIDGEALALDDPREVSRRAASGGCPFCKEALERFSSLLGAASGDLALMLCALGRVYISGGLCRNLGALFDRERFRARFVAKGRFVDYLSRIPIYLVTRRDPGLLGAAAYPMPG